MMKRHNDRWLAAYLTGHFSVYFQEHLKRTRDEKKNPSKKSTTMGMLGRNCFAS